VGSDDKAPPADTLELVRRHRLAREATLVLEHVIQVFTLQPRQPPPPERVIGTRAAPPRDLEVDEVRTAVVADEDVLRLVESTYATPRWCTWCIAA
jgi:hypothetical protein